MKRNWFPYLAVFLLLALLACLATLQYQWLGQISDAENVRLKNRLDDDTKRFARDFDQELQKAFYSLQVDTRELENGDLRGFNKRFVYWQQQAIEPGLIKAVYYKKEGAAGGLKLFDQNRMALVPAEWGRELSAARIIAEADSTSAAVAGDVLIMPLFNEEADFRRIVLRRSESGGEKVEQENIYQEPQKSGFLLLLLDRDVIGKKLFPMLVERYFTKDGGGSFQISVTDQIGESRIFDLG